MTASRSLATRVRWVMLIAAIACWIAGLFWVAVGPWVNTDSPGMFPDHHFQFWGLYGTPAAPLIVGDYGYLAISLAYVGVFLFTQWFLFGPRGPRSISLTDRGRPMILSIVVAALVMAILSAGFAAIAIQLTDLVERWPDPDPRGSAVVLGEWRWVWCVMAGMWGVWAIVFYVYWRRGDRYTQFTRLIRALVAGSIVELIVAAPVHAMADRDKECYCAPPSYTALVFGGTVLLWAMGPGVVLLFLHERYRRTKLLEHAAEADRPPTA